MDRRAFIRAAAAASVVGVPAVEAAPVIVPQHKIMYVCEVCAEHNPEGCGHYDRDELRVMPSGQWVCDNCYDDGYPKDFGVYMRPDDDDFELPRWYEFPMPPEYCPIR